MEGNASMVQLRRDLIGVITRYDDCMRACEIPFTKRNGWPRINYDKGYSDSPLNWHGDGYLNGKKVLEKLSFIVTYEIYFVPNINSA